MPTDDERRSVAERLRGLNGNIPHVRGVYEADGLAIFCDDQADYYQICYAVAGYLPAEHMHPCDYEELHACLADLIEPAPKCDREALLELAGEMDGLCGPWHDCGKHYARRIREACGEAR